MHPKREDEIKKKELEKKERGKSEGRAAGVTESSPTSSIIRQEDDIVAHKKETAQQRRKITSTTTKYTKDEMKYVSNFKDIFASFLFFLVCFRRVESRSVRDFWEKEFERTEMIKDPPFL